MVAESITRRLLLGLATKISTFQIRGIDRIPQQGAIALILPDGSAKPVKLGVGFSVVTDTDGMLILNYSNGGIVRMPSFQDGEVPQGNIDGVNVTFMLQNLPNPPSSLSLEKNGLGLINEIDYKLLGSTITFFATTIPQNGDTLIARYRY